MQNTNAHVASEEREEIPNEGKAAQQLEQILASGLPRLYRRAYRILGNATADAEDAVQDALLAAYTHLHQFRGQAQISTWLTTIMLNCARLGQNTSKCLSTNPPWTATSFSVGATSRSPA